MALLPLKVPREKQGCKSTYYIAKNSCFSRGYDAVTTFVRIFVTGVRFVASYTLALLMGLKYLSTTNFVYEIFRTELFLIEIRSSYQNYCKRKLLEYNWKCQIDAIYRLIENQELCTIRSRVIFAVTVMESKIVASYCCIHLNLRRTTFM